MFVNIFSKNYNIIFDLRVMQNRKILIIYNSGYGTTREIAERIYNILSVEPRFNIHLKKINDDIEINNYDGIIIGSSVRADQLLANTRDFLSLYKEKMLSKKIALFIVSLKANSSSGQKEVREKFINKLSSQFPSLKFMSITAFGGKIDMKKLNPVMQNLIKHVFVDANIQSFGSVDSRDWDKISKWAFELKKNWCINKVIFLIIQIFLLAF